VLVMNRAFSAGVHFISQTLGRRPRLVAANPSGGVLPMDRAFGAKRCLHLSKNNPWHPCNPWFSEIFHFF
jgi:hypothetical protein